MTGITRFVTVALAAIALGAGALWMTSSSEAPAASSTLAGGAGLASDTVTRQTLRQGEEFSGSLGYGESFSPPGQAAGTVTWVPDKGAVLRPGDLLYKVDERPTYWAQGDLPMYRSLASGSKGVDVEQLQRFLQDEGYLGTDFEIDGKFGSGTRNAVKAWQGDHDFDKTGRIDASQLLFLPHETLRVAAVPRIGEQAIGGVIEVTAPDLFVSLEAGARKKKAFEGSPTIEVELADGTRHKATVDTITAQQSQDPFGEQKFQIRLQLAAGAVVEPGEVSVEVVDILAENALTVPARALVALVEGGYAVEVVSSDGGTQYRAVEIGEFADGWVQVAGDVAEGDTVVVPR